MPKFDPTVPIEQAFTPAATWYFDKDFYHQEQAALKKMPIYLGMKSQLNKPGDYFTGEWRDIPYILSCDDDKQVKGFYNICSHHGTCIAKGRGNTESFVCPYHGWTYNSGGALKKIPKAGKLEHLKNGNLNLKEFYLHEDGPFLFGLGDEKVSYDSELQVYMDKLRLHDWKFVAKKSFPIACNWKVYVDNYLDGGYHVPHMHPKLAEGIDFDAYHSDVYRFHSVQKVQGEGDPRLGDEAWYLWMFPHFMVNRYGPWMDTNFVVPTGPKSCEVVFEYYLNQELSQERIESDLKASEQVQREDEEVCLMVQKGMNSGVFKHGVYAPGFEKPMYEFHKRLAELIV